MSTKEFGLSYFFASCEITDFLWMQQYRSIDRLWSTPAFEIIKGHHPT
jgi:hypothetical protein